MTEIVVITHGNEEDVIVEGSFDDVASATTWLIANLAGWCLDEDVEVLINGISHTAIGRAV